MKDPQKPLPQQRDEDKEDLKKIVKMSAILIAYIALLATALFFTHY
jgi:hypothetical protein